jgi:hypothetical protein
MSSAAPHPDFVLAKIQPLRQRFGLIERAALEAALSRALLQLTLRETERRLRGAESISKSDRSGSASSSQAFVFSGTKPTFNCIVPITARTTRMSLFGGSLRMLWSVPATRCS